VDFVNGGGVKIIESVKGRSKSHLFTCFGHISIKITLDINRERSEAPVPLDPLVFQIT